MRKTPPKIKVEEKRFDKEVRQLYINIVRQMRPASAEPMAAIVRPPATDNHMLRFDEALLLMVHVINKRMGPEYMSLCYEGDKRWSVMGSLRAEWLEFEYISAKHFKVTKLLRGRSSVICSFRNGGNDMQGDIRNAFNILAHG